MTFAVRTHQGVAGGTPGPTINVIISANAQTVDIRSKAVGVFGSEPPANSTINVTVSSGITLGAAEPASPTYTDAPGVTTGSFANSGIVINMLGSGDILGYGGGPFSDPNYGGGAQFGSGGPRTGAPGYQGGDGFWITSNVTVDFSGFTGTIAGGGGQGGGGTAPNAGDGGGGGGGGAGSVAGFSATFGNGGSGRKAGSAGAGGGLTAGGAGGTGGSGASSGSGGPAGNGSAGGAAGIAGTNGIKATVSTGAGGGGGGGGLGANGGSGGDLLSAQGVAPGGAAGAWVRRVGGVGTVIGVPTTHYGPVKNT